MSHKISNKTKALKNGAKRETGFFKALLFSLVVCVAAWLVLDLLFSLLLLQMNDSNAAMQIISPVIASLSLAAGGFTAGKLNKNNASFISLVLGCIAFGICYAVSILLDLSHDYSMLLQTVIAAAIIVFPIVGAKLSLPKSKTKHRSRKRM